MISVVHLVLDMLAFKSDVSFWRSRKNNYAGISARAVWINAGVRTLLFLYLLDQDASRLVLFSSALSLAINVWKAVKILRISVGLSSSFPFVLRFGPRPVAESLTQQHDSAAMKWLALLAAPLVLGAAAWSLVYHTHKSWYSWLLGSCASAVYAGGFILMTPQLFVNYKLKSVAHLPLRVFIYRACNTFIGTAQRTMQSARGCRACASPAQSALTPPPRLLLLPRPLAHGCRLSVRASPL